MARKVCIVDRQCREHRFSGHLEVARTAQSVTVTVNAAAWFLFVQPLAVIEE